MQRMKEGKNTGSDTSCLIGMPSLVSMRQSSMSIIQPIFRHMKNHNVKQSSMKAPNAS